MTTWQEKSTFRHCEGVYACLLVPRNTKKSNYGQLLHNIGWAHADDNGIFLLDDGTVKAYKVKEVDAATDRLVHGAYDTSTYKQGLDYGKHSIKIVRQNIFKGPGGRDKDQTERVLKEMMAEALKVFRAQQKPPRTRQPTSIVNLNKKNLKSHLQQEALQYTPSCATRLPAVGVEGKLSNLTREMNIPM